MRLVHGEANSTGPQHRCARELRTYAVLTTTSTVLA